MNESSDDSDRACGLPKKYRRLRRTREEEGEPDHQGSEGGVSLTEQETPLPFWIAESSLPPTAEDLLIARADCC